MRKLINVVSARLELGVDAWPNRIEALPADHCLARVRTHTAGII